MYDFKKAFSGSKILQGKAKLSTDELIRSYPNGIHINACDLLTGDKGEPFAAFNFTEDPASYFFGGKVLTDAVVSWVSDFEGDVEALNAELYQNPLGIRMGTKKTKDGKYSYTTVEII